MTDDKPLILMVDDMPINLHLLVATLRDEYRIKVATNGADALNIAALEDTPKLILLDVMMPQMSGIEMMQKLRSNPETKEIPVIFISADTSEQSQLKGLELGADDYLTKPVIASLLKIRVRNLIQRRHAETQLRLAAHVFEHSGEAIIITDSENQIIEANNAFSQMSGYSPEKIKGKNPSCFASGKHNNLFYKHMWQELLTKNLWQGEIWNRHYDGHTYPKLLTISAVRNALNKIDFFIGSFANIDDLKATEKQIRHIAHHDPLTQLPNRLYLKVSMPQALMNAQREKSEVAVMFIDLDRFKIINDTLGHHVGDLLLIEVGKRIQSCVRDSDLVVRLGGDEFVVMSSGIGLEKHSSLIAEKIISSIGMPYHLEEHTLHTSPSIGISIYPQDGDNPDTLMRHADTAMYHAKELGRNNAQYFSDELNQAAEIRLCLETSLREALNEKQFSLHYQPQFLTQTGEIVAIEALVRWNHPQHGTLPPGSFLQLAEETGLINAIGNRVIEDACQQLKKWLHQGIGEVRMAINLSMQQLRQTKLIERIQETLTRYDIPPRLIELEITETVAMHNAEETIQVMHQLRKMGINLAIDDFGTGYSSLSHLKHLPVQRLKLDRTFVKNIETDSGDAAICVATVGMAHALGLEVVAEGVETEAQRQFLNNLGCDLMQGFLFAEPTTAEQVVWSCQSSQKQ